MKEILLFFCIAVSAGALAQTGRPDPDFHLYLLIGQSNMAGRAPVDEAGKKGDPRILMLDSSGQWVTAKDPLHFDKPKAAGVGPGRAFAAQMLEPGKKIRIGLIPCAWGGSPIKVWQPGARYFDAHPYDDAVKRTRIAMQQGVLKGVLWHQGESDNDPVHAAGYMAQLTELIKRLRTDLQSPGLPFVAGEIGYFNKKGTLINTIINQLPQQVPYTAVVTAAGLTDKGDLLHFNTASARELGKRYAAAMKQLQKSLSDQETKQAPVVALCFDDAEESHYSVVAPLLKKYRFGATFMVCEFPRKTPADTAYYLSWSQIAALHRMGFEIGNHTGHHKNMTKMDRAQMQEEIRYIETKCGEYGIPKPVSFAYPGNRSDSLSQVVLKEMGYRYARQGGSRFYDPEKDPALNIPSYTMGAGEKLGARTWQALKSLQPRQILVFTIHGVPDTLHPGYTTAPADLEAYLRYMKAQHFKVVALRDLGAN